MNSAAHWQTLLALFVLLVRDANMFEETQYEVVGVVLLGAFTGLSPMLLMLHADTLAFTNPLCTHASHIIVPKTLHFCLLPPQARTL